MLFVNERDLFVNAQNGGNCIVTKETFYMDDDNELDDTDAIPITLHDTTEGKNTENDKNERKYAKNICVDEILKWTQKQNGTNEKVQSKCCFVVYANNSNDK